MRSMIRGLSLLLVLAAFPPLCAQTAQLTKVGEWGTGTYNDVGCLGRYAYCTAALNGVDILDMADPAQPVLVGRIPEPAAYGIFIQYNLAYVAGAGLGIWDLSNPVAPSFKGRFTGGGITGGGWDVYVAGSLAYLVDWGSGLHIIDVSDPAAPAQLGQFPLALGDGAADVFVLGSRAYLCGYASGLHILDVSDPAHPQEVGVWEIPELSSADGIWAAPGERSQVRAYLLHTSDETGHMEILDVTSPASPVQLGTYSSPGYFDFVSIDHDLAYITNGSGLEIVSVSSPASPALVGSVASPARDAFGVSHVTNGPYVYQAMASGGVRVIFAEDPANPVQLGSYDRSGRLRSIGINGHYAYVGDIGRMHVFDFSSPDALSLVGSVYTSPEETWSTYTVNEIEVSDSLAYLADGAGGVQVFDVSSPAAPVWIGGLSGMGNVRSVASWGDILFVANGVKLIVLLVSDPAHPVLIGSYDVNCDPVQVRVYDHYAFLVDRSAAYGGLQILDITNPATPVFVGGYDIPEASPTGIAGEWPYAYLSSGGSRVYVLDVTDPTEPVLVSTFNAPGNVSSVTGGSVFLAVADSAGLHLEDVSVPERPQPWLGYDGEGCLMVDGTGEVGLAVTGDWGKLVSFRLQYPDQGIRIHYNETQAGQIFPGSPSQIAPATFLTFQVDPYSLFGASASNPIVLELTLPPGAVLSQTLATGTSATTAPLPTAGEMVADLAVTEYALDPDTGWPIAVVREGAFADVGPHAVQLLRYVAGETTVQVRINQSSLRWVPSAESNFLGFTIGLGGGVWPPVDASNWGAAGRYDQASTLFYLDLRNFAFAGGNDRFMVGFNSFEQQDQEPSGATIIPDSLSLFQQSGASEDQPPAVSQVGSTVTDMALADMNGDGRDDLISIDGAQGRLYIAFGQPDGTFQDLAWWELPDVSPSSVAAGDVTGDGRPEVLIGTTGGLLVVILWEDLFGPGADKSGTILSRVHLRLAGTPADSVLLDVDGDSWDDYLYVVASANQLVVFFGNAFTTTQAYTTGTAPESMTGGDFDGDHDADVAVANRGDGSVDVYRNDGLGNFTGTSLAALGGQPVDLDAGDFNRDGKDDLAVVFSLDKDLAILLSGADSQFHPDQAQRIYFQNVPSAVVADNFDGLQGPDALVGFADYSKLALCLSDANGALSYSYHLNILGDVVVDPFNAVTLGAGNIISMAAGTSLGGIVSNQGLAGVSQQPFGVVHFPQSAGISFSVVNLAAKDALLNLELIDDNGKFHSCASATLGRETQYARYFGDLLGGDANLPGFWVRGFLSLGDAYGLWLVNDSALNYLDGTRAPDVREALSEFVIPVLPAGKAQTAELVLLNPLKAGTQVRLTVTAADGSERGTVHRLLPGRGRLVIDPTGLVAGETGTDSIRVRADHGIVGIEIFGDTAAKACLQGLPVGSGETLLYSPHLAVGDFGGVVYSSTLTLVNTGSVAANLTLTLRDDSGAPLAPPAGVTVPAGGKSVLDVAALFGLATPATGYLAVATNGAGGIAGCVSFGDAQTGRFLSCLPLETEGHARFILGHIANGAIGGLTFFTGLAVLNTDTGTRSVTVTARDQEGVVRGSAVLELAPGQRRVDMLGGLIPGLSAIFGGYLTVSAPDGSKLMVFELFGDTGLSFLSAVPAAPLPE